MTPTCKSSGAGRADPPKELFAVRQGRVILNIRQSAQGPRRLPRAFVTSPFRNCVPIGKRLINTPCKRQIGNDLIGPQYKPGAVKGVKLKYTCGLPGGAAPKREPLLCTFAVSATRGHCAHRYGMAANAACPQASGAAGPSPANSGMMPCTEGSPRSLAPRGKNKPRRLLRRNMHCAPATAGALLRFGDIAARLAGLTRQIPFCSRPGTWRCRRR